MAPVSKLSGILIKSTNYAQALRGLCYMPLFLRFSSGHRNPTLAPTGLETIDRGSIQGLDTRVTILVLR